MQGLEELEAVKPGRDTVVTIGVFDGVHRGHLHLLEQVRAVARREGLAPAVVTFRNHPLTVLQPQAQVTYLCTIERRLELLRQAGAEVVAPVTFTRELSQRTAREFVTALRERLRMRWLLCGPDFALGKGRQGTVSALTALGKELGYRVAPLEPFMAGGQVVSSTAVRQALARGDVRLAAELLGRVYSITGRVAVGDRRGRALGFPTANLEWPPEIALPADGIYATIARAPVPNAERSGSHRSAGDKAMDAVTSIGVRPTFGGERRTIETFVLDFTGDLYGKTLTIDLIERLRGEERFASVEALVAQMHRDVQAARDALRARAPR